MLEEVGRGEGVVANDCTQVSLSQLTKNARVDILRESSRWLWLPTLGFSMKN